MEYVWYNISEFMSGDWLFSKVVSTPDSKVHGANMGPIWGRQDPGGPYVGPMNLGASPLIFFFWPALGMSE